MFRCKTMLLEEWGPFQNRFEEVFMTVLQADKRTALFIESVPAGDPGTLLIPPFEAAFIEALAPGGWEDCLNAADRKWVLLVGHADSLDVFGLPGVS